MKRNNATERTLPHDLDAERALLGALIVNPKAAAMIPPGFEATDFFRVAHQLVYAAIQEIRYRGQSVDLITVCGQLKAVGNLNEVGGPAYVAALTDAMPSTANVETYARVVMAHAARRRTVYYANDLVTRAYASDTDPGDLIAHAQKGLTDLSRGVTGDSKLVRVGKRLPAFIERIEQTQGGNPLLVGVATGFRDLDEMTGGFQRGDLILIAARPSQGKTALALAIADRVTSRGRSVAMFSLEMTEHQLMLRLICSKARVDSYQIRNGYLHQNSYDRLAQANVALAEQPLAIDDTSFLPVEDLLPLLRKYQAEEGALDMAIVDYLTLLGTRGHFESRQQQVSHISRTLKAIAKELNIPLVALAQLSRAVDERKSKRPILSDLRESGSLEQDADLILFPYRADDEKPETELIIGKARNGPTGVVKLNFVKQYTAFDEPDAPAEREVSH